MDGERIKHAVEAFFDNLYYYPRLLSSDSRDQAIWSTFSETYLRRSAEVIGGGKVFNPLPGRFIEALAETQRKRMETGIDEPSEIDRLTREEIVIMSDYPESHMMGQMGH